MSRLDDHPTVRAVRERETGRTAQAGPLDAEWLRFGARGVSSPVSSVLALAPALIRRRIRLREDPRLLLRFGACFPV